MDQLAPINPAARTGKATRVTMQTTHALMHEVLPVVSLCICEGSLTPLLACISLDIDSQQIIQEEHCSITYWEHTITPLCIM